jgi:hypothetical protein
VDLLYRRDGGRQPQVLISDTGSYTDMVFGLLRLLGVSYRPELADLPDQKLWRINTAADYGMLDATARGRIDPTRVKRHWPDILRLVASVHSGAVSACDVMRMLQHGGNPTQLGHALAHLGRIFKTLHVLVRAADGVPPAAHPPRPGRPGDRPLQPPGTETVFDPFVGSGTTAVEAVYAGRRAIGVDIDPRWVELTATSAHPPPRRHRHRNDSARRRPPPGTGAAAPTRRRRPGPGHPADSAAPARLPSPQMGQHGPGPSAGDRPQAVGLQVDSAAAPRVPPSC